MQDCPVNSQKLLIRRMMTETKIRFMHDVKAYSQIRYALKY